MPRLVAFGCSNTFGMGLDDCWDPVKRVPGEHPSQFAWPAALGNILKRQTVNLSRAGSSNREILWRILNNYNIYNETDIVVILWTFKTRYAIITEPGQLFPTQLFSNLTKMNVESEYYKTYKARTFDEYDSAIESLHFIDYADRFLKDKVKHVMNYVCDHTMLDINELYTQVKIIGKPYELNVGKPANDGSHPGPESHFNFANRIVKDLNNLRKTNIIKELKSA